MTSAGRSATLLTINLLLLIFDYGTSYSPVTITARLNPSHLVLHDISTNTCHHHENNNIISFPGNPHASFTSCINRRVKRKKRSWFPSATNESMLMSSQNSDNDQDDCPPETENEAASALGGDLIEDDWKILSEIIRQSSDDSTMEQILIANLPQMPPRLTLALRSAADGTFDGGDDNGEGGGGGGVSVDLTEEQKTQLEIVGKVLVKVMDGELKLAKVLLLGLLDAGEVRKLDGKIAGALKDGKLDMAFFSVLNMNLADAAEEERLKNEDAEASGEKKVKNEVAVTTRYQILQHVYTRCQEEIEKTVSPGAGLLNKLLRTEMDSIRQNQLKHYLVPEENTITSADGSEIKLPGAKALVPPKDFLEAMEAAVIQIRTVEKAGGADRATAAGLVESCRQVAIEARLVIMEGYGTDDEVFLNFQDGLQPVFRPTSAESEYISGN